MNEDELLEFGTKRENEERRDGGCTIVFYPKTQKYVVYRNLKNGTIGFFGGGFDEGEDELEGSLRELREESGLIDYLHVEKVDKVITHYHNSNKDIDRVALASCFLVVLNSLESQEKQLEEHENFELIFMDKDEILEKWTERNHNHDYDHWVYFLEKANGRLRELGYN